MWRVKSLDAIMATAAKKSLHRSLGPVQLTLLGIGAIIGTGIFVLTAAAAQKAGPGMMRSASSSPAPSAPSRRSAIRNWRPWPRCPAPPTPIPTPSWASFSPGCVGWALILEYAVAASAVSVGWSGYVLGLIENGLGFDWPDLLQAGPTWSMNGFIPTPDFSAGIVNIPAIIVALAVTALLMIGTTESAPRQRRPGGREGRRPDGLHRPDPAGHQDRTTSRPSRRTACSARRSGMGIVGAAASIFFAYVGFDAVSTAAEETKNPQRNVPIGLIGSLAICTIFYLLVAAGAVGAIGAQPVLGAAGRSRPAGFARLRRGLRHRRQRRPARLLERGPGPRPA